LCVGRATIASNTGQTGLQDKWEIAAGLTLNYGARFDVFNSSFDNEHQLSLRPNFIYKPMDAIAQAFNPFNSMPGLGAYSPSPQIPQLNAS